ncbi:hypothetical protein FA15DRAFT_321386 [Coprinopsis marcescibilis]|uniref:Uncharacterized protein n=1 Tax=Coprinopsis marcescibilis TaxID=230819 RepID=A0A5C3L080_COPMA|nr:hypothetical protein FA15DRAFT_321386 [Coprinopsis marcescibilis]
MVAATRSGGTPNKNVDSPTTTPSRKAPQCNKCKRPRAGHPRSGCPFVDSPTVPRQSDSEDTANGSFAPAPPSPARRKTRKLGTDLNEAMGSMTLGSPGNFKTEEDKKILQNRRRSRPSGVNPLKRSDTILSLTTSSQELVENLLRPGVLSDETDTEGNGEATGEKNQRPSRVVKWQETLIQAAFDGRNGGLPRPKSSTSSPMPGTLITPNASFFVSSDSIAEEKPRVPIATRPTETSFSSNTSVPQTSPLREVKPLARSMSMEERQMFVSCLGAASNLRATIYVLPKADIEEVARAALDIGFAAHIATNENEDDDQALLILGSQEVEVEKLTKRIEEVEEAKQGGRVTCSASSSSPSYTPEKPRSTSTSAFKAAAGGAVVGAVGLWAGLAFS